MSAKHAFAFLAPLTLAAGLALFHPVSVEGQGNPQCPTRPTSDASNACASTQFTQNISAGLITIINNHVNSTNIVDVFLIAGQSNAVGQGTATLAPTVVHNAILEYCANGAIQDANDPVCSAISVANNSTGSAWPSFGQSYYAATGRSILFVLVGVGGTGQVAISGDGGANWDTTGSLFPQAISILNTALTSISAQNMSPQFKGVLWSQGEHDAAQISLGNETIGQYTTAFVNMISRFRRATIGGQTYPSMPFYIFRTGTEVGVSDSSYAQIRAAQEQVAAGDTLLTRIVFRDASDFPALGNMSSGSPIVHYNQPGYNMMGWIGAANVLAAQSRNQFQPVSSNGIYTNAPSVTIGYPLSANSAFGVNYSGVLLPNPIGNNAQFALSPSSGIEILGNGPILVFRSPGTNVATPTGNLSGDNIGLLAGTGYDSVAGWATNGSAAVNFRTAENWNAATNHGTKIAFRVTPLSSATPADAVIINANRQIQALTYPAGYVFSDSVGNLSSNSIITLSPSAGTVGFLGFGTETNPQWPFVFSLNSTTGIPAISGLNGAVVVNATGASGVGWNALGYANSGSNTFIRIDGNPGSPSNLSTAEIIGGLSFGGWGAGTIQGGRTRILGVTTEAWTTTFGAGLEIDTTPAGGNRAQAMRILGGVVIGPTTVDPGPTVLLLSPQAFSALTSCTATIRGSIAAVSDSTTVTWGNTITGTGTNPVIAHCNGTNWTVMGK